MKTTSLLLILTLLFNSLFAQLSENDAKLRYQQITDAYDKGNYPQAYQSTMQLIADMKSQPPKLTFMLIKSAQKCLENGDMSKTYENFSTYATLCDSFLNKINKATYPADKLKEIENSKTYFVQMQQQYAYTKGRTPQDAIDFLNECARLFPLYNKRENEVLVSNTTTFRLEGTYLIVTNLQRWNDGATRTPWAKSEIRIVDLAQVTGIVCRDFNGHICKECGYCNLDGEYIKWTENGQELTSLKGCVGKTNITYKGKPDYSTPFADTATTVAQAFAKWNHSWLSITMEPAKYWNGALFDQTSVKFQSEKYANRIKELFQFLIDAFPKKKEETPLPKSKF